MSSEIFYFIYLLFALPRRQKSTFPLQGRGGMNRWRSQAQRSIVGTTQLNKKIFVKCPDSTTGQASVSRAGKINLFVTIILPLFVKEFRDFVLLLPGEQFGCFAGW
jgi:hypothetical protein